METLFDHNPTQDELDYLLGPDEPDDPRQSREDYLADAESDPDFALADLYHLFLYRKDPEKAAFYLYQIKDLDYRRSIWLEDFFDPDTPRVVPPLYETRPEINS